MVPPTKSLLVALALALCITTLSPARCPASILITVQQVGPDVVVTGIGTAITGGLAPFGTFFTGALIAPSSSVVLLGPTAAQSATDYFGVTGPASFGSGGLTSASSGTGQRFGLDAIGATLLLEVPSGYVSGALLAGESTYLSSTFASLGITPGTYTYNFGSGLTADTLDIQIGRASGPAVAAPDGGSTLLLLSSAAAILALGFKRGARFTPLAT